MENETAQNQDNGRMKKIERFLFDQEAAIFESIEELNSALATINEAIAGLDLASLEMLPGENGKTPVRGEDYFTDEDVAALQRFIEDRLPRPGFDFPTLEQMRERIDAAVSKIPRVKGDKGEPGKAGRDGKDGKNGSPDTGLDIIAKIRSVKGNQMLKTKDVRGLDGRLAFLVELSERFEDLDRRLASFSVTIPANGHGSQIAGKDSVQIVSGDVSLVNDAANPGTSKYYGTDGSGTKGWHSLPSGGSAEWGDISGTLSDQTDLASALSDKVSQTQTSGWQYVKSRIDFDNGGTGINVSDAANVQSTTRSALYTPYGAVMCDYNSGSFYSLQTAGLTSDRTHTFQDKSGTLAHLDDVLPTVLTGLNVTGGTITSSDTLLQAFGKAQNQINGLVGGVTYMGTWNASTNSPSISSGTGTKGHYYVVSTPGSTAIDGISDWKLGDWIIFNGTVWEKVDNTDAVISVNGYVGAVTLALSDFGITASATEINYLGGVTSAIQTQLNGKQASGSYATLTGVEDLENKRITKRVGTVTQSATPSVNTDNMDIASITGLAQAITNMSTNLTGTPVAGDMIMFQITDNGTARAISWGSSFSATTVALPTTTVISTMLRVLFQWNGSTWACISVV